jgi:hypothetical protein
MNQAKKKKIAAALKIALKGAGVKYTLGVHHHSSIVMNIQSAPVDLVQNHLDTISPLPQYRSYHAAHSPQKFMQVNTYWYREHFSGVALDLMTRICTALNEGNHDRSDIQSDYFDVGWYVHINIGRWDKPFQVA